MSKTKVSKEVFSKRDKYEINLAIDQEGFEYTFLYYDSFDKVKDKKFHKLRRDFINAKFALEEYLNSHGVGEGLFDWESADDI